MTFNLVTVHYTVSVKRSLPSLAFLRAIVQFALYFLDQSCRCPRYELCLRIIVRVMPVS